MALVEVQNLVVRYENFNAVDGISFSVEKGEIFGLLGPNAAGKTSAISALTRYVPYTGKIQVVGKDIAK